MDDPGREASSVSVGRLRAGEGETQQRGRGLHGGELGHTSLFVQCYGGYRCAVGGMRPFRAVAAPLRVESGALRSSLRRELGGECVRFVVRAAAAIRSAP